MLVNLDDVPKHSEMEVGLKAWNLSKARAAGVSVPFTVIVPSDVISGILSESGIRHQVFKLSRTVLESEDPAKAFQMEKELRARINSLSFPDELLDEVMDSIAGNVGKMMVARPSPYATEMADGDLKGRMSVWYDEPTKRGVVRALQRVLGGAFSLRSVARMMDLGIYPEDLDLAIMIQSVVFPRSSGISVCCPARRRNELLIESTWGLMDGTPKDRFKISMDLMEVVENELSEKKEKLVPSPQGVREVDVPHHLWMEPSIRGREIEDIARISSDLSLILGTPTLVEWIIQEGTDSLFVIQAHKEPERPPVKALERKVLGWLEERKGFREIREAADEGESVGEAKAEESRAGREEFAGREGVPRTVVGEAQLPLVASKVYVQSGVELPPGVVDGRVLESGHEGAGPSDLILLRDPADLGSIEGVRIVMEAESLEEAREKLLSAATTSPRSEFLIYLGNARLLLASRYLSDIYDGAVIPINLESFSEALLLASSFDILLVDLGEEVPDVDRILEALSAGVEGFIVGGSVIEQMRAMLRAERRYLMRKIGDLEQLLSTRGELE